MAIHGLSTYLYAPLADEDTKTYTTAAAKLSGAIEATPNITYNNASIYSDNKLKHKDVSFQSGTLALIIDFAKKDILSPLTGRTVLTEQFTTESGEVVTVKRHISNANDKPVPQGFGYIVHDYDVDNKIKVYSVRFFYKVEFASTFQTIRTKEDGVTYTYAQLLGTIFELPNGDWMEEEDFTDLDVAIEYLESLFQTTYVEARLESLSLVDQASAAVALVPAFDRNIYLYQTEETAATTITATAESMDDDASVTGDGAWATPAQDDVKRIVVTNGGTATEYVVIINKSA